MTTHIIQAYNIANTIILVQSLRLHSLLDIWSDVREKVFLGAQHAPIMVSMPSSLQTRVANVTKSIVWPS